MLPCHNQLWPVPDQCIARSWCLAGQRIGVHWIYPPWYKVLGKILPFTKHLFYLKPKKSTLKHNSFCIFLFPDIYIKLQYINIFGCTWACDPQSHKVLFLDTSRKLLCGTLVSLGSGIVIRRQQCVLPSSVWEFFPIACRNVTSSANTNFS